MANVLKIKNEQGVFIDIPAIQGPPGPSPKGGTTGQVLTKASDQDGDLIWSDAADPNAIIGDGSIKSIVECSWEDYKQLEHDNLLKEDTEYHIDGSVYGELTGLTEGAIRNIIDTTLDEKLEGGFGGGTVAIENSLTSDSTVKALSAAQGKLLNEKFNDYALTSSLNNYLPTSGGTISGNLLVSGTISIGTNNANTTDTWIPVIGQYGIYEHTQREFASSVRSTHFGTNGDYLPTLDFLSFWNGAYDDSGHSNITYCKHGAIGTMATQSSGSYLPLSGGTMTGELKGNSGVGLTVRSANTGSWREGIRIYPAPNNYTLLYLGAEDEKNGLSLVHNPVSQYYYVDVIKGGVTNQIWIPARSGTFALVDEVTKSFVQSSQPTPQHVGDIWFIP